MVVFAPTVTLNNGKKMPVLGLGTWAVRNEEGKSVVRAAIDAGYRHFDTALLYQSEPAIGEAIREKIAEGVVKREDLFIVSKLWCSYAHPGLVLKGCKKTLENLGLDYIDLYLMHWPFAFKAVENPDEPVQKIDEIDSFLNTPHYFPRDESGNLILTDADHVKTWKEMEECVRKGMTRSIGVSNFNSQQLERLIQHASIKPVVNQVEVNPYFNQKKLIGFCKERNIWVTAYCPLGASPLLHKPKLPKLMEHPTILKIAQSKKKTPAQVILRFLVQFGAIVIPKTVNLQRLVENISIFDFNLSAEEMAEMELVNRNERLCIIPGTEGHKDYPFSIEY